MPHPTGNITRCKQGDRCRQCWAETCLEQTTRAAVAKSSARPEMPAQAQHLRAAFRAKVWFVHSEDSDTQEKRRRELHGQTHFNQSLRPPSGFQLPAKATQTAVAASENGAVGHQIVEGTTNFSEDVAATARSRSIAKSLACRDTQYLETKDQKSFYR